MKTWMSVNVNELSCGWPSVLGFNHGSYYRRRYPWCSRLSAISPFTICGGCNLSAGLMTDLYQVKGVTWYTATSVCRRWKTRTLMELSMLILISIHVNPKIHSLLIGFSFILFILIICCFLLYTVLLT